MEPGDRIEGRGRDVDPERRARVGDQPGHELRVGAEMIAHPHPLSCPAEPAGCVIADAGQQHPVPAQDQLGRERFGARQQVGGDRGQVSCLVDLPQVMASGRQPSGKNLFGVFEGESGVLDGVRLLSRLGQFGQRDLVERFGVTSRQVAVCVQQRVDSLPDGAVDHGVILMNRNLP